jgi:hypothetical protein
VFNLYDSALGDRDLQQYPDRRRRPTRFGNRIAGDRRGTPRHPNRPAADRHDLLATLFGLLALALKLGAGGEAYAPLALAIIGGLTASFLLTIFIVTAAFVCVYGRVQPTKRSEVLEQLPVC